MIYEALKILIVEDDENDYILLERQIRKIVDNPTIVRVIYFSDFTKAFETLHPDIIISDYKLKDCDGLEILEHTISKRPDITFLFVTGTFKNEQIAENTILSGATGYILKKDINTMNVKLLPYFTDVVSKKESSIDSTQKHFINSVHEFVVEANCIGT